MARRVGHRVSVAGGALLLGFAATGCGGSGSSETTAPTTVAASSSSSVPSSAQASAGSGPSTTSAGRDATLAVVQSAAVPANCDMPAMRLSGGTTPASYHPKSGNAVTDGAAPLLVDMKNAGSTQVLWRYTCNAGGVGWPETLVLSDAEGNLAGSLDLGPIAKSEHAEVTSWSIDGRNVTVQWKQYEGAGFDVKTHNSTVSWKGGKLSLDENSGSDAKNPAIPDGAAPGAGGPRPADARPLTERASGESTLAFQSPSGKNGCMISTPATWVRCGTSEGPEVFMDLKGNLMDSTPADDAPSWLDAATLDYGQVRYDGNTVFAVTEKGVTVWNTATGHGAFINTLGIQRF